MKHPDEKQDKALIRSMMVRTDPSVKQSEMETRGEPLGCVPMSITMGKPMAYRPAKSGPK